MNTWSGKWSHETWPKAYVLGIEDPFDATDNPGRSIMRTTVDYVAHEFNDAAEALHSVCCVDGVFPSASEVKIKALLHIRPLTMLRVTYWKTEC